MYLPPHPQVQVQGGRFLFVSLLPPLPLLGSPLCLLATRNKRTSPSNPRHSAGIPPKNHRRLHDSIDFAALCAYQDAVVSSLSSALIKAECALKQFFFSTITSLRWRKRSRIYGHVRSVHPRFYSSSTGI
ncbi:hypothetical protein F5J12DRAFT_409661 [Pisolithus orientalis]|uniref:uncharacterized protein n=1 Tax=Pisolithus orientalis TaxID=936130 RepID=UPI0022252DBB|nr:uncharacterized protein F5J12DRAFT_409661 [Pisolithus orientalis]KAI5994913.1 hypothetical protein F5J12DRAFT_409661 [Pisolithus orientalis]